ncbi:MAG: DedA family protein, partial [Ilumatobacteraceae bacterium]
AKKESTAKKLKWAADQIEERGGLLLITARFIPGGRTILTLSSGLTKQSQSWFMGWVGVATIIWASYAAILGFAFGERFEDDHTLAFILAFAAALAITVLIEVVRWLHKKRTKAAAERTAV